MKVLSVNTSLPIEVEFKGKKVKTGIYKTPVNGSVKVKTLNIEGDGQADLVGHGGEMRAVYVYSYENYSYWEKELSRESFPFGQFGENLTVQGMLDDKVHIGDQFRIGSVLFEVSQPRVPCFKLAMKMEVEGFYNDILKSGRLGFYFRVLEEGEISSGDEIKRTLLHPKRMTIERMTSLMYFDKDDYDGFREALRITELSPGWKATFEDRLAKQEVKLKESVAYRTLVVSKKIKETPNVSSFYLKPDKGNLLSLFLPGQFLPLKLDIPGQYQTLYRTYTLSNSPSEDFYRLTIKRERAPDSNPGAFPGVSSNYFHDQVDVGTKILAASPRGQFYLSKGKNKAIVLISAGVGITPMLSMLNALITEGSQRSILFIHSARNGEEHIMKKHLEILGSKHNSLRSYISYSKPNVNDVQGKDYDLAGRIDGNTLIDFLKEKDSDFYICGPSEFMKSLISALIEWGVAASNIHYENFGPSTTLLPQKVSKSRLDQAKDCNSFNQVKFKDSDIEVSWNSSFDNLLDFAEAQGLNPSYSCRSGICQTCECKISEGEVKYINEPLIYPSEGSILLCSAVPETDVILDL